MGSTGAKTTSFVEPVYVNEPEKEKEEENKEEQETSEIELVNTPTNDENDLTGETHFEDDFSSSAKQHTDKWFANPKLSNYTDWKNGLSAAETDALDYFTGHGYDDLNAQLYDIPWSAMSPKQKKRAADLYEALNKFELNKTIHVSRATALQYFGVNGYGETGAENLRKMLEDTGGIMQFNGFQSTSTGEKPAFSGSVVIHYTIPPSKGAGAYVRPISMHPSEKEFLVNSNGVFKFDPKSVKVVSGVVHVNAEWIGQAADQVFKK